MFLISGLADIGIKRSINQDSIYTAKVKTSIGEVVFSCVCDGMGGLKHGEIASSSVVNAFRQWVHNQLKFLTTKQINKEDVIEQWSVIIAEQNNILRNYGISENISLGTTLTALLIAENDYFVVNVGDSRLYEITPQVNIITKDHTFVQQEVDAGRMTEAEAAVSKQKHILTRCIGVTERAEPDFYFGKLKKNAIYMICSDGFRHKITNEELSGYLNAEQIETEAELNRRGEFLIGLNKERLERDNISVAMVVSK